MRAEPKTLVDPPQVIGDRSVRIPVAFGVPVEPEVKITYASELGTTRLTGPSGRAAGPLSPVASAAQSSNTRSIGSGSSADRAEDVTTASSSTDAIIRAMRSRG